MTITYTKPALTVDQQITLLESRGLTVKDIDKAQHYLQFINYYRLSGYSICFEQLDNGKRSHQFNPGTTFDDILALYNFDRHLRIHVMDAIERIEVAIRTQICLQMAVTHTGAGNSQRFPQSQSTLFLKNPILKIFSKSIDICVTSPVLYVR